MNVDSYVSTGEKILCYNMFAYCNNNWTNASDFSGNYPVSALERFSLYEVGSGAITFPASNEPYISYAKTKPNMIPNPNKRKGSEKRQPSGDRERNVGHPNGEEHSRVPKGNRGIRHMNEVVAFVGLASASILIISLVVNDVTGVGMADNMTLISAGKIWWDYATAVFG